MIEGIQRCVWNVQDRLDTPEEHVRTPSPAIETGLNRLTVRENVDGLKGNQLACFKIVQFLFEGAIERVTHNEECNTDTIGSWQLEVRKYASSLEELTMDVAGLW